MCKYYDEQEYYKQEYYKQELSQASKQTKATKLFVLLEQQILGGDSLPMHTKHMFRRYAQNPDNIDEVVEFVLDTKISGYIRFDALRKMSTYWSRADTSTWLIGIINVAYKRAYEEMGYIEIGLEDELAWYIRTQNWSIKRYNKDSHNTLLRRIINELCN